jgi:hypothetical protein
VLKYLVDRRSLPAAGRKFQHHLQIKQADKSAIAANVDKYHR